MSLEDLKAGIRQQVIRYGYTEVYGDQIRELPFGWVEAQGYRKALVAGTDTYVVYRPRESRWGDGSGGLAMWSTPFSHDDFASRVLNRQRDNNGWALGDWGGERPAVEGGYNSYGRPPAGAEYRIDDSVDAGRIYFVNPSAMDFVRVDNLAVDDPPFGCVECGEPEE